MSAEKTCDVIVIGGGIAGLVTAVRAAELGLSVTLLEKGREERYLCNARMSGGVFHLAFHDPKTSPDELLAAVNAASGGHADPVLAAVAAKRAGDLVEWLRGQGARFIRAGSVAWQNYILAPPRPLRAGIDWMGRGPDVLLRQLSAALQQRASLDSSDLDVCSLDQALVLVFPLLPKHKLVGPGVVGQVIKLCRPSLGHEVGERFLLGRRRRFFLHLLWFRLRVVLLWI